MSASNKRDANHLSSSKSNTKKPRPNGSITSFFGAPSPKVNNSLPTSAPFDKDKWIAGLTAEQKALLELEINTLDDSWLAYLKDEIITKEFLDLKRFLKKEMDSGVQIFPPPEDIYSWSRHTPLHKVKAVIIGQDPYHNHRQAHGLCFSVRPPTPAPPSLQNIYVALKKDYPTFQAPPNKSGLLTPWAERGVLMINTCLTVRAHNPKSHSNQGWERFTQKAIDIVAKVRRNGVVFLAWGTPAAKRVASIQEKKHYVLKSVHPSPLSARHGFFTCGHFKKANEWLRQRYGEDGVIDWDLSTTTTKAIETKESLVLAKENKSTVAPLTTSITTATVNKVPDESLPKGIEHDVHENGHIKSLP